MTTENASPGHGYGWLRVTAIIAPTRAHVYEGDTELRVTKCNRDRLDLVPMPPFHNPVGGAGVGFHSTHTGVLWFGWLA